MEGGIKPSPVNMSRIGDRRVRQHLKAAKLHTCDLTSGITRAQRLLPESHFVVQLRIAVWTGNARDTRPQPDVARPKAGTVVSSVKPHATAQSIRAPSTAACSSFL